MLPEPEPQARVASPEPSRVRGPGRRAAVVLRSKVLQTESYGFNTSNAIEKSMLVKMEQDLFRVLELGTSPREPARLRSRETAEYPQRVAVGSRS